jgi:hypothetical protein
MPEPHQSSRPKFDTMFTDARHYRGDCRLLRTAVRHGWMDEAPQADRDALIARLFQSYDELAAEGFSTKGLEARAAIAQAWVLIEMTEQNMKQRYGS